MKTNDNCHIHNVRFYKPKPEAVCCLSLCNKTNKLALSRLDASLELWNITNAPFIERIIPSSIENYSIESLAWYNKRLFSVGLHGFIVEYDLFRLDHRTLASVTGEAAFSLDICVNKSQLAVGTEQGYVNIFNINDDGVIFDKFLDKQEGRILCIKYSHCGQFIVAGGLDAIRIWDSNSGHVLHRLTTGRSEANKSTIVWCLTITKDFTIISGDSRGKLTFWDGEIGAQIESYKTHQADIVSLCLSEDEKSLFCSGVDPNIINYVKIKVKENNEKWVKNKTRKFHTHDVRALVLHENKLYSSGVDGYLGCSFDEPKSTILRYPPILDKQCVTLSKNSRLIMLRHKKSIEIWKLGKSDQKNASNEVLDIKERPKKLLVLERTKINHNNQETSTCIIFSTISEDGKWIAYGTKYGIRVFQFVYDDENGKSNLLQVQNIDDQNEIHIRGIFNKKKQLITALSGGELRVFNVSDDNYSLVQTIETKDLQDTVTILAGSNDGKYLVASDPLGNVMVWIYKKNNWTYYCKLPMYKCAPLCLSFNHTDTNLILAYSDNKIIEYDLVNKKFTDFSRYLQKHPQNLSSFYPIRNILYDVKSDNLILQDDNSIMVLHHQEEDRDVEAKKTKKVNGGGDSRSLIRNVKSCRHLVSLDWLSDNEVVAVQVNPLALLEQLPPVLLQKKFGTK